MNNFTRGELLILEWQYANDCLGGFENALMEAICRADEENLVRLELGFPDQVRAYRSFKNVPGWFEELTELAIAESVPFVRRHIKEEEEK